MPPRSQRAQGAGSQNRAQKEEKLPPLSDEELERVLPAGLQEGFEMCLAGPGLIDVAKTLLEALDTWCRGDPAVIEPELFSDAPNGCPASIKESKKPRSLTDPMLSNKPLLAHVARLHAEMFTKAKVAVVKLLVLKSFHTLLARLLTGPAAPASTMRDPALPTSGASLILPLVSQCAAGISAASLRNEAMEILLLSARMYGVSYVTGFLGPLCLTGGPKNVEAALRALTTVITKCGTDENSGFDSKQFQALAGKISSPSGSVKKALSELKTLVEGPPFAGGSLDAAGAEAGSRAEGTRQQSSAPVQSAAEVPRQAAQQAQKQDAPAKKSAAERPASQPKKQAPPRRPPEQFPSPTASQQLPSFDEERLDSLLPEHLMTVYRGSETKIGSAYGHNAVATALLAWSSGEPAVIDMKKIETSSSANPPPETEAEPRSLTDQMLGNRALLAHLARIHAEFLKGMRAIQARQNVLQSFDRLLQRVIDSPAA